MPDEKLLPFIYCYWELKTETQLAEKYLYRVIADGCVDIFFPLENPDESYIMGFCKSYTEFSLGKQFHYIGIRFFTDDFSVDVQAKRQRIEPYRSSFGGGHSAIGKIYFV